MSLAMTILALAAAAAPTQATPASAPVNPKAVELFDSDWVIKDWGLRFFDRDRDGRLSATEASTGALAFKEIADGDNDGRVTPHEFRRAREFLLARY